MLKVMVFVYNSDNSLHTSYILDHEDVKQRKRLGFGCKDAFEHGQRVVTIPEGHPQFDENLRTGLFTERCLKNFYTKENAPKRSFKSHPKKPYTQKPKGKSFTDSGKTVRH